MKNLTLIPSALKRFAARHDATLALLASVLLLAGLFGLQQRAIAQHDVDEDRQIAEHGCTRLPHEDGKPDRILCPGNIVISKPSPGL